MNKFQPFMVLVPIIALLAATDAIGRDKTWQDCELGQQDPDRSIAACSRLLTRSSRGHPEAFHNRGIAHAAKGNLDQAISDISQGIRLDPHRAYRWQERGEIYTRKGNYAQAISDLTEAIRMDPTRAFRFSGRGQAYRGLGDLTRAISDYSEAIRLDPVARVFRFYERGNALRDAGQYDRALADYETALQLEPTNAWLLLERGRTYAKMGQVQSARQDFDGALGKDPTNAELRTAVERERSELPSTAIVTSPSYPTPTVLPNEPESAPPEKPDKAGLSNAAPTLRHPSHGERAAVLVVPGAVRSNARNVIAHADEEAYRKL